MCDFPKNYKFVRPQLAKESAKVLIEVLIRKGLIDGGLLNHRNQIAHGEMSTVSYDDIELYKIEIIELLDGFAENIIGSFESKRYINAVLKTDHH